MNHLPFLSIVVDRLIMKEDILSRVTDSVEVALKYSGGLLIIDTMDDKEKTYSEHNVCNDCQISFRSYHLKFFLLTLL